MKAFLAKLWGYLATFFLGVAAALAFVVAAILGQKKKTGGTDAENSSDNPSAAAIAEANRRAIIDRALDRARELSRLHRADGGRIDGDPNRSD